MKKILSVVTILMLVLSLFTSCGSSSTEPEAEQEEVKTASLYLDVNFEGNLILNKYDVFVEVNGDRLGEIKHGDYFTHLAEVPLGECKIEFINTEKTSVTASKDLTIESDTTYKCTIHTDSDEIVIIDEEVIDGIEGSSLKMPDVVGTNLEKAKEELEAIGFVNVVAKANDDSSIFMESDWVVIEQSVVAGTEIDKNQEIVLTCREETEQLNEDGEDQANNQQEEETVEFSKDGNKGIYAYKDKGGAYSNYYIIDFDEGYVYSFTDEDGNKDGEKIKIDSGDLNEGLKLSYKNDENAWIDAMHFHYKNNPAKLIIVDYQYNEWEYNKTGVDNAKKLMKSKTLTEH